MPFDHAAFLTAAGADWVGSPDIDMNPAFVEVRGDVVALPSREALVRAAETLGLTARSPSPRASASLVAERDTTRLEVQLLQPFAHGRIRQGPRMTLTWRDRRERAVEGGVFNWQGRPWPAYFDAGRIYHESRDLLMLEGRTPSDGEAACVARYRAWAVAEGFAPGAAPGSLAEVEPDLGDGTHFHDAMHEVVVELRGAWMMLRVQRRDAD